jgi:hypothetical protein
MQIIYQEASVSIVLQRKILKAEKEETSLIKDYQVIYIKNLSIVKHTKDS